MRQCAERLAGKALLMLWAILAVSCGGGSDESASQAADSATAQGHRSHALAVTPAQAALAKWTAPIGLTMVPISGTVLSSGKVLFWAADVANNETYTGGGKVYTTMFDPRTNTSVDRIVTVTKHDMFCPGTARLSDGKLLVNGGNNANVTSIYDPAADTWSRVQDMGTPRGYNASTLLGDGTVLTMGGSWNGAVGAKPAEVYTPGTGWRSLVNVTTANAGFLTSDPRGYYRSDNHMWLFATGNGRVLQAGPSRQMNWIDPRGTGATVSAGQRSTDTDSMNGNAVMYDAGKILAVGGATAYDNTIAKKTATVIDVTSGVAQTRSLAPMAYPRTFANSVVLPTGQVVVMGGQTQSLVFSDSYAVLPAELWDPQTETFAVLPSMSVARNYHSIGLLLPDARVISAGGGLCNCAGDHKDMQILSPPYLFNADGTAATRPAILAAPTTFSYGGVANVTTDSAVAAFSMVRLGASTHTVNNDQRRISLTFVASGVNTYQLTIPTNPGLLLPGQWMLFAMTASGTPSVAAMVSVGLSGAPTLANPGSITATTNLPVNLPFAGTTPFGSLTYSATGLPAGLSIGSVSGAITGSVATAGRYVASVFASNGTQTVSTDVVVRIEAPASGTGLLGQYFGNTTLSGSVTAQNIDMPRVDVGALCAKEMATCAVAGTQVMSFGLPGAYVSKVITGSASCDYRVLGDPMPGVTKACYAGVSGVPASVPSSNFSARWTGWVEAVATGPTPFQVRSSSGVRMWINQQLVVDNWVAHNGTTNAATVNVVAGQRYPVTIEYFQGTSAPQMLLQWQPVGDTMAPIPLARLYPAVAPSTVDIALGKTATQISTLDSALPARAVDGNTDGNYVDKAVTGTVSHTNTRAQDWWQVDIGRVARIDVVQLWNRTNCCVQRLNNFMLFVSPTDMTGRTLAQLQVDPTITMRQVGTSSITPTIGIPVAAKGRYVRVQLLGADPLSLAEVQVFGDPTIYGTPIIATIAGQSTPLGSSVSLSTSATDPGGNTLTYSATGLPSGLAIDAASGAITGTVNAVATSSVTVTVSNAGGQSASTGFAWTVLGGVPPVVSLAAPVAVSGSPVTYSPVLGSGAMSQYSWNFGDGSGDSPYGPTEGTSHVFTAPGVYTVTLSIRTVDGLTATQQFVQAIFGTGPTSLARASSTIALEPRSGASTRLWVVNADNDSVSVFDTASNVRMAEVTVGSAPRTLALAPDGRMWVVSKQLASIGIVDPVTLSVAQTVALPRASQPHGIVFSPSDGSALVSLEATGQVVKLSGSGAAAGTVLGSVAVGDTPRQLALTAAGDRLLVSRFVTRALPGEGTASVQTTDAGGANLGGEVVVVDPAAMAVTKTTVLAHSERVDAENQGRGIPNYLGAAAISPDGASAWIPSKQDNVKRGLVRDGNALNFQNTVRSISSRIDLGTLTEDAAGRVDHDNAGVASAAVYHPTGAYLFVALETNRQVAVIDVAGKRELFRYEVGLAPQGLVVSADGLKLYVNNFMERSVSVVDLLPLVGFGQTAGATILTLPTVTTDKLPATVLRGKQLFYDARDPRLSRDSYMSCASCHNDGGHDGRTWDFTSLGEGLRNTIALKGRAGVGQGFMHWSANFDEVQDFEGQIRTFSGGTGLMADADFATGTRSQPLGDKKAGVSADLDALAAYVGSLSTFANSPFRNGDGSLTPAAVAGKAVFTASCVSCHGGNGYTLSSDASQLKDVGTIKPTSGQRLNGPLIGIDIPTLRDVWSTAPYLHDGSAGTLSAAVNAHNTGTLASGDLANVVAYLQQIGAEEAAISTAKKPKDAGPRSIFSHK